jgi:hypothetical protein
LDSGYDTSQAMWLHSRKLSLQFSQLMPQLSVSKVRRGINPHIYKGRGEICIYHSIDHVDYSTPRTVDREPSSHSLPHTRCSTPRALLA